MTTFNTTQWAALVEAAYDRKVEFALRSNPTFRQVIDKHPEEQAMPGDTVTLTIHKDLAPITTALDEELDGNEVTVVAPDRVIVTLHEYGSQSTMTGFLTNVAFTQPLQERAIQMANQQADSIDLLVKNVMDTTTNEYNANASGALGAKTTVPTKLGLAQIHQVITKLRGTNVAPTAGNDYVTFIHPNHGFDLRVETGPNAWIGPATYGGDTAQFYAGETGRLLGSRIIETPRCAYRKMTISATDYDTYPVYVFGRQALVEANAVEPHTVVGNIVDVYRRKFPLGWYGVLGHALYRSAALYKVNALTGMGI